ncbi:hypothetical protein [Marinitoga sp. 38H-ov]|uniref:hypothetical protein n=1 Tax=Marinitoga sp. 38H-ov TaxID=1755814 RepID=UPI0013ED7C0D|nr:hypothetical protein [Marinitoga sp. 38H-ov]KAF2956110.1 hypothetical protein AS160_08075 [Marinitoga sp. 38H-ov]
MRINNNIEYFKYFEIRMIDENFSEGKNKEEAKEDVYIKTEIEYMKATYSNLYNKKIEINSKRWKELKNNFQMMFDEFKAWVEDKIKKQLGITQDEKIEMKKELEYGKWSPENVSDRVIEFAKSISNGDKSKIELLKNSVKEGFDNVKGLMGGTLPEVSEKTYNLVMKKFESWEKGEDRIQIEEDSIEYINVKQEVIKDNKR